MRGAILAATVAILTAAIPAIAGYWKPAEQVVSEALTLYKDVESFWREPEFREVGFARCCKYSEWMEKALDLKKFVPAMNLCLRHDIEGAIAILPSIGMFYLDQARGRRKDVTVELEVDALNALYSERPIIRDCSKDPPAKDSGPKEWK